MTLLDPATTARLQPARRIICAISVAVLAVGGLVLCETVCRFRVGRHRRPGSVVATPYPASASDYLPFTLAANLEFAHTTAVFQCRYRTNFDGFRDDEPVDPANLASERRILLCGDSFTLGWGVAIEQTFGEIAEADLNRSGHGRHRVLNAGYRAGYTLDHYYAFLVRESAKWQPAHVVVAVYLGNDLSDLADNRWAELDAHGLPVRIATRRAYPDVAGHFVDPARYDWPIPRPFARSRILVTLARVLKPRPYEFEPLSAQQSCERAQRAIEGIIRHCRDNGRLLTWLVIPPPEINVESDRCRQVCMDATRGSDCNVVFVSDVFAASGQSVASLYIQCDGHLSLAGHKLTGVALANAVRQQVDDYYSRPLAAR